MRYFQLGIFLYEQAELILEPDAMEVYGYLLPAGTSPEELWELSIEIKEEIKWEIK